MMMRKEPNSNGTVAVWKLIILSAVSVKPRSLKAEAEVKIPLYRLVIKNAAFRGHVPPGSVEAICFSYRTPSTASHHPGHKDEQSEQVETNEVAYQAS